MISIRRFAFAAVLALTTLNFAPSLASGQEATRGKFTLTHQVRWGNASVPAGNYEFSLDSDSLAHIVTINRLDRAHQTFMLLVHDTEDAKSDERARLVLATAPDGESYVRTMHLPEFGITLGFAAPSRMERQLAKAATGATALGQ